MGAPLYREVNIYLLVTLRDLHRAEAPVLPSLPLGTGQVPLGSPPQTLAVIYQSPSAARPGWDIMHEHKMRTETNEIAVLSWFACAAGYINKR